MWIRSSSRKTYYGRSPLMITMKDVEEVLAHLRAKGVSLDKRREELIRRDITEVLAEDTPARQIALLQEAEIGYEEPMYYFYRVLESRVLAQHPDVMMSPENWPVRHLQKSSHQGIDKRLIMGRRHYLL